MATSRGAVGVIFASLFFTLSLWAVREMRLGPVNMKIGDFMVPTVNSLRFKELGDTPLRTYYTGIAGLDYGLRFLVVAFLPGASGFDKGQMLQQAHFLLSIFPVIAIFSVEAGRKGNSGALISFTSIWALLYQTVGGAIIVPLYFLAYMSVSAKPSYWSPTAREVSLPYAQALLPSLIVGYLVPTILMYLPYDSPALTQGYIALWQPSPLIVNILLFILSGLYRLEEPRSKSAKATNTPQTSYVKHLNRAYITSFLVAAVTHVAAAAICFSSPEPNLTFSHAFLPTWKTFIGKDITPTLPEGLLHIFQMDFWIIFIAALVWAYLAVLDVNRISGRNVIPPLKGATVIAMNSILFGPAATLAAIWYWREQALSPKVKTG